MSRSEPGSFDKWMFPIIKSMPTGPILSDIIGVQPINAPPPGLIHFEMMEARPERPRHALWHQIEESIYTSPLKNLKGEETYICWSDLKFRWEGTVGQLADEVAAEVLNHRSDCPQLSIEAKAKMLDWAKDFRPGDVIYEFDTDQASWAALAGRGGYVILRGRNVVAGYVTHMS